ncbi:hypothetical protein [Blastococcus sp. Marseille-P5729]|uniref:hypothetical protein n=1 Tax=Blastococcus sp. Marseille-P5729 TaxID=2086582 RepID=UPI000D0E84B6|nr:hypothetical protein [Blastococcus sp. Marseille-P5729]
MSGTGAGIDYEGFEQGRGEWEAAASSLQQDAASALSKIQALSNEGTWGGDEKGQAFAGKMSSDPVSTLHTEADRTPQQLVEYADTLAQIPQHTLTGDQEQSTLIDGAADAFTFGE